MLLPTGYSVIVQVSHVAETRKIDERMGGIWRGKTNEGVVGGEDSMSFILSFVGVG
jgi:hypothetical protein